MSESPSPRDPKSSLPAEPNWSPRPNDADLPVGIPLLRIPQHGTGFQVVVSREIVGVDTHYFKGRTLPCTMPVCPACMEFSPKRWHGYLYVMSAKKLTIAAVELTAGCAQQIDRAVQNFGSLYKLIIQGTRQKQRANGKIEISASGLFTGAIPELRIPPIKELLKRIWSGGFKHVEEFLAKNQTPATTENEGA